MTESEVFKIVDDLCLQLDKAKERDDKALEKMLSFQIITLVEQLKKNVTKIKIQ
jgi:hypothetical protein